MERESGTYWKNLTMNISSINISTNFKIHFNLFFRPILNILVECGNIKSLNHILYHNNDETLKKEQLNNKYTFPIKYLIYLVPVIYGILDVPVLLENRLL